MAWPLSALTSYTSNSTPAIKASDLNSIQEGIYRLYAATWSVKSLYIDGTGGNVVAPAKGRLYVAGGTSVVAGDFALANWGAGASVAITTTGSTDARGAITITAGAGATTGNEITFTYKDLTWGSANYAQYVQLVYSNDSSGNNQAVHFASSFPTATVAKWYCPGLTPVDTKLYTFNWLTVG